VTAGRAPRPAAPPLPPGRHVVLPGRGTTFVRQLDGPPGAPVLLLLHGWTAPSDLTWFACFEELSHHFGVVAMDLRGHGRGLRSRAPFRLEDCADDAAALVDVLGLRAPGTGPLVVVGYSLGGCVAQLLWRRHGQRPPTMPAAPGTTAGTTAGTTPGAAPGATPGAAALLAPQVDAGATTCGARTQGPPPGPGRVLDGLVLCATSAVFAESREERRYFAALGGIALASRVTPAQLRRHLAHRILGRRVADCSIQEWIVEELRRNDATALLEAGKALGTFDSRPWAADIDVPVSVVVTTEDRQVAPARQRALARAIAGAPVHEVAAGHDACASTPRRFLPALVAAATSVAGRVEPSATASAR